MSEKDKLNTIEILIIRLYISHDKFVSINNVLRQYKKQKNPEIPVEYIKKTLTYCDSCKKKKKMKKKNQVIEILSEKLLSSRAVCGKTKIP